MGFSAQQSIGGNFSYYCATPDILTFLDKIPWLKILSSAKYFLQPPSNTNCVKKTKDDNIHKRQDIKSVGRTKEHKLKCMLLNLLTILGLGYFDALLITLYLVVIGIIIPIIRLIGWLYHIKVVFKKVSKSKLVMIIELSVTDVRTDLNHRTALLPKKWGNTNFSLWW